MSRLHPFAVSGLRLTDHLDKEAGSRVSDMTMEDGDKLQADALYTVSYVREIFPAGQFDELLAYRVSLVSPYWYKICLAKWR